MKNLARTLPLFLIFSGKYYKSKTRNIMTELCYEKWFTTQTNDKVLIKQTKSQKCTYSCAGQKLTILFSIQFLIKLFSLTFSLLYKTPSGYCTSIASQVWVIEWFLVRNSRYWYKNFWFVSLWGQCLLLRTMSLSGDHVPYWGQRPLLGTTFLTGDNVPYWGQCTLGTMSLNSTLGLLLRHLTCYDRTWLLWHI